MTYNITMAFEIVGNKAIVQQIAKESIDPFDYTRLCYLALEEWLDFPIVRESLPVKKDFYNPLTQELVLAPNPIIAEAIEDFLYSTPSSNILSVARSVSMARPGSIVGFFNPDPHLRAWAVSEKNIDDIGDDIVDLEALRGCFMTAYDQMHPNRTDSDYRYSGFDEYYDEFAQLGVNPITPELLAAWMSRPFKANLERRPNLARIIFPDQQDQSLTQIA
jgi:hypothetical protein